MTKLSMNARLFFQFQIEYHFKPVEQSSPCHHALPQSLF